MAMTRCKANLHFYDKEKHSACPYCEGMTENREPTIQVEKVYSETGDTCTAPTVVMEAVKIRPPAEPNSSSDSQTAGKPAKEESAPAGFADQEMVQTVMATPGLLSTVEPARAPVVAPEPQPEPKAEPEPAVEPEPVSMPAQVVSPYEQFVKADTVVELAPQDPDQKTVMFLKESSPLLPVVGWLVSLEGPEKGKDYRIKSGMNEVGRENDPEVDIVIKGDAKISRRHHAIMQYDPDDNEFYLIRLKNDAVKVNDATVKRPIRLNAHDIIQFGETRLVFVPLCSEKFRWTSDS